VAVGGRVAVEVGLAASVEVAVEDAAGEGAWVWLADPVSVLVAPEVLEAVEMRVSAAMGVADGGSAGSMARIGVSV